MPSQVADISAALAYQVKKEIAENYFGSRKTLEAEREELEGQEKKLKEDWERMVLPHLSLIGQFLVGIEENRAFLTLIKRDDLFEVVWPGLKQSGIDLSPTACAIPFALTIKGKYKKVIFHLYQTVKIRGDDLWNGFQALQRKKRLFNEDLAKFTSGYNLSDVLSLVRSFENRDDLKGVLGENTDPQAVPLLEEKLILRPIDLVPEEEALFRPLPPRKEIQNPLKLLIDLAYQSHCSEIKKMILPA
jgi:hypothetical protein